MSLSEKSWIREIVRVALGIVAGIFVLHPAAMFIKDFHGIKPVYNWNAFTLAFSFTHIPMTIYFAFLGASIGLLYALLNEKLMQTERRLKIIEGILPICSFCKKIQDDDGLWRDIEEYIDEHSEAEFLQNVCRSCAKKKNYPRILS